MPVRRSERPNQRPGPYNLRRPATSDSMAAAMVSTMPSPMPWHQGISSHTPSHSWQSHMPTYQPPVTLDYTQSLMSAPSMNIGQIQQHHPAQPQQLHDRRPSHSHSHTHSASQAGGADGPWTSEMDGILIDAQSRGLRWEQISQQYFPHKSANACRKRFGRAKEERRATDWNEHRISRVIDAYNKEGLRERMWGMISRETGERWQDIEKLCYSQGISRIVRSKGGHSRTKSRVSVGHAMDDTRYHSSNDEYDPQDDSGIGLGLMTGPDLHARSQVNQSTVTTSAPLETMLVQSNHNSYQYL